MPPVMCVLCFSEQRLLVLQRWKPSLPAAFRRTFAHCCQSAGCIAVILNTRSSHGGRANVHAAFELGADRVRYFAAVRRFYATGGRGALEMAVKLGAKWKIFEAGRAAGRLAVWPSSKRRCETAWHGAAWGLK